MRSHRNRTAYNVWTNRDRLAALVSEDTLQVARMEPVIRQMHAAAGLDLLFAKDGQTVVVPLANLEATMLTEREKSPVVWPHLVVEAVDANVLDRIESVVLPWIEALSLGRQCNAETIRRFGGDDDAFALFQSARAAGFMGASPYRAVMLAMAPYVYAVRFAENKLVQVADPAGAAGAALLARYAREVRADLGSEELNALAERWYGIGGFGAQPFEKSDLCVASDARAFGAAPVRIHTREAPAGKRVSVATPIPYDVMVSFDVDDAPEAAAFSVECDVEVPLRSPIGAACPPAVGGSAGRILLLVRESWMRADEADSDDARELARRLCGEGFSAQICSAAQAPDVAAYDLVHAFGLPHAAEFLPLLRTAAALRKPVVATAGLEDLVRISAYGSGMTNVLHKSGTDEVTLEDYLTLLAERRLETEGFDPRGQEPVPGYLSNVREALGLANVLLVSGPAEEAFVREQFGYGGPSAPVAAYLNTDVPASCTETLVGDGDFVLVHAPIEARANQLLLVRAAISAGLPVVLAGPVSDVDHYMLLREIAGERVIFVPAASDAELEALYRRARVFADVSWAQTSLHRLAKAALARAALVVSSQRYAGALWRPGVFEVDPADVASIRQGLIAAWNGSGSNEVHECARRVAAACDPAMSFVATVSAYGLAQQRAGLNYAPA